MGSTEESTLNRVSELNRVSDRYMHWHSHRSIINDNIPRLVYHTGLVVSFLELRLRHLRSRLQFGPRFPNHLLIRGSRIAFCLGDKLIIRQLRALDQSKPARSADVDDLRGTIDQTGRTGSDDSSMSARAPSASVPAQHDHR
jgi:hypothetical protein